MSKDPKFNLGIKRTSKVIERFLLMATEKAVNGKS